MHVVSVGDVTLADEEYVKIGDAVIDCTWIKSIRMADHSYLHVVYGSGGTETLTPGSSAYDDMKALYEFRLALALKNEPEGA